MQPIPPQTAFGFSGPLYAQVASYLRVKIYSGAWTPAAPLPNEAALAKDIGVSIGTVRKALELLEEERLIDRRQGRGTFVVDTMETADSDRFSMLKVNGRTLRPEVSSYQSSVEPPPADAAKALGMKPDAASVSINLGWRAENFVRGHDRIIAAASQFPGLTEIPAPATLTLFGVYRRRYQIVVHRVVERIEAELADDKKADALGCAAGRPILKITRLAKTRTGDVVEWAERAIALNGASYDVKLG
jgi:GntR family transcriptional regulator